MFHLHDLIFRLKEHIPLSFLLTKSNMSDLILISRVSQVVCKYVHIVFALECMTHVAIWWKKYKPVDFLCFLY